VILLYAFPEPFPLERARGVQVAHAVACLAQLGIPVEFAYVPAGTLPPFEYYGLTVPEKLTLTPLSRSLSWPLGRVHSNRFFLSKLGARIGASPGAILFVRHLKLAAMLLRRYPGRKLVYEAHEVFSDTGTPARHDANFEMEASVMRGAALVIANSAATAARLSALHGGRKVEVLANGVDWPEHIPEKDWTRGGEHIVYSGSLFGWKGVDDLVDAAADLPGCRITIIGGNAEQVARLRARASKDGAQLVFCGQLPHTEVLRALGSACIAVLPNRDEPDSRFTSPIKLFEYMAAGCAVVTSDLPALRDVLSEDDAVWFRPGDPAALAAGIGALAGDPERARKLGERLRETARLFTWQARAEKLAGMLKALD
jgi:glycosyltransferase involved in cell wall biosynthesis